MAKTKKTQELVTRDLTHEHPMRELVADSCPDAVFIDGHDDAIIGFASRIGMEDVAAYDYDKVIGKLVDEGLTHEEAIEHFDFNIIGAWVGEQTPVFVHILPSQLSSITT